eukprot:11106966-Heterocapsa_arctica.AAC.1
MAAQNSTCYKRKVEYLTGEQSAQPLTAVDESGSQPEQPVPTVGAIDPLTARRFDVARCLRKMADYEVNITAERWFDLTTDWTGHFGNIGVAEILDELFATVVGLREKGRPGVTHDQI